MAWELETDLTARLAQSVCSAFPERPGRVGSRGEATPVNRSVPAHELRRHHGTVMLRVGRRLHGLGNTNNSGVRLGKI